jgi:hypothetical protein
MNQPTIEQLREALDIARKCEGTEDQDGTLLALNKLRYYRTTWAGSEQNKLRVEIDEYLRVKGGFFYV